MSKVTPYKKVVDLTKVSKSTFTLTFAIEIVGLDVWHDCNEGWLDLGPCHQAIKIQYQLYPEQSYDLDILIWPHVAKIWCGTQYAFVRTWQFLERRWFAFSIRHAFPVRVLDLINHIATVNFTMGFNALSNNAKNDKNIEAFLPPLKFGERRYFGTVLEKEEGFEKYIRNLLWNLVQEHIPASYLDGNFDTPHNVTDIRHQDATLIKVKEIILRNKLSNKEDLVVESEEVIKPKNRRESKTAREKEKKKAVELQKEKFLISLSGDAILAGTGKVITFKSNGERPQEQSELVVLISTKNLPGEDDLPIILVNIEDLYDVPINEFKKARITQIYTRWELNNNERVSQTQYIKHGKHINFNDHHTVPLQLPKASEVTATFLNKPFEIQLRGLRNPVLIHNGQKIFGNNKNDIHFDSKLSSETKNNDVDILIAVTKIDASILTKKTNAIVAGEFSLYPPQNSIEKLGRADFSTNDINGIILPAVPDDIVPASVILDANMTINVSIGLVGCKPRDINPSYSRMLCLVHDAKAVTDILQGILQINKNYNNENRNNLLTGFAIDIGDKVIFFIEGQKNGRILEIYEMTTRFYPMVKPLFSCSEQYLDRIYSDMLTTDTPFEMLKMFIPLNALSGCPQAYVKPNMPIPAKSAFLKFARLVANKVKVVPFKSEMPTSEELKSFSLELCVPLRCDSITMNECCILQND